MTAFQVRTFVPRDGTLSITVPEYLRETNVELSVSKKEVTGPSRLSKEGYQALLDSYRGTLHSVDNPSISDEEYLEGIRSLRGILPGAPDSSGLRDETDREL